MNYNERIYKSLAAVQERDRLKALNAELLEALKAMIGLEVIADAPDDDPTLVAARAAIAKAEGRT